MTAVFAILMLLIALLPAITIAGGVVAEGLLLGAAASALVLVVLFLPARDVGRLAALLKPIGAIALVPFIWILIQIAPVPAWLAHPAWTSAAVALNQPIKGAISLDIGATLLGFGRYSLALAIVIVATAVALDRQRAQAILLLLTTAAAAIATGSMGLDLVSMPFVGIDLSPQRPQMQTIAVVGLVLSCATAILAFTTNRQRRASGETREFSMNILAAISIASMAICGAAISTDAALLLAAFSGAAVPIGLEAIYRLRLGPWGRSGIAAAASVGVIGFLAAGPVDRAAHPTLAFSSQSRDSIAAAERMLADAKWAGTGAGTFEALLKIYRDVDDGRENKVPTAAASIAIEMGRPFLWGLVILALIGAWSLTRRALMRGREHVYAGVGAGCIVALLVSSFANAGILGLAASVLASAVLGLALAQSRSRSN